MRNLIPTDDKVVAGSFLFDKKSEFEQFLLFCRKKNSPCGKAALVCNVACALGWANGFVLVVKLIRNRPNLRAACAKAL